MNLIYIAYQLFQINDDWYIQYTICSDTDRTKMNEEIARQIHEVLVMTKMNPSYMTYHLSYINNDLYIQ